MRYETIKSAILIILVLLSVFLTWNLWTYQPNYATMESSNYVAEVTLSEKQEVKKIVKPDLVLYHNSGIHYGTNDSNELNNLMKEMGRWSFYGLRSYPAKAGFINELANENKSVEIVFPAEVPVVLYKNVLNFTDRKIPSFNFDRIFIDVGNVEKDHGTVYFVSTATQQVYISYVSASFINGFNHNFYQNANKYPRYFAFKASEKRTIFLPENATTMMEYEYLPTTLNSDEFKDDLFTDPSFVQKSMVPDGEEYTNGSSKMNIYNDTNMLVYVNPTADGNYTELSGDLVKRSIDFVNDHGGWTDEYRYVEKNDADHNVIFRLYTGDGYPVFNEDGLSEINETWGRNDINKYVRPDITLELPLKTETRNITIPSGHEVLKFLLDKKNFRPELLENVTLGYEMSKDAEESKLILLQPMWFYRYDKTWYRISAGDLGGMNNGLE